MATPPPTSGVPSRYALVERERRWLLAAVPPLRTLATVRIRDRYLDGARLRLREATTVEGEGAGTVRRKLTQKLPGGGGGSLLLTTIYLDEAEHRLLDGLPGAVLRKTRLLVPPLGVDRFEGGLAGLVLAEAEFADDGSMAAYVPPPWAVVEVTGDPDLTGGRLARTTARQLRRVLAAYGLPLAPSEG